MQNGQSDVLLQKIKSAHFEVSAYPHLEEFAAYLGEEIVNQINEQIRDCEFEIRGTGFRALTCQRSFDSLEEKYSLFASRASDKSGLVFVSVSNALSGAVSEAMFGGACTLDETKSGGSSVDAAVVSKILDNIFACLNRHKYPKAINHGSVAAPVQSISYASPDIAKLPDATLCNISFDIGSGEESAAEAILFHFPMNYLEARGLLEKGRVRSIDDDDDTSWSHDLKVNVEGSEIELGVILESYEARLSELTNLQVGDVIPLSDNKDKVSKIILNTIDGPRTIGAGRLGAYRENKAVKLISPLDPAISVKI